MTNEKSIITNGPIDPTVAISPGSFDITNGVKPGTITNGEVPWRDEDYGF